jgi:DNA-binding response OmpR family regulator
MLVASGSGMNANQRESLAATVRILRDTVLVTTENASELESIAAWAGRAGLELRVGESLESPRTEASDVPVLLRVAQWPAELGASELVRLLGSSGSGATLVIVPEGVADFDVREIPDDWDFVRRPCDCRELVWRAERALSRLMRRESSRINVERLVRGPLCLDMAIGEIRAHGAVLNLRRAERDVLSYLMHHVERFVSAEELQREVLHSHGNGGAARNQIYELRRKLRAAGLSGAILSKGHGGYRLRWSA